MSFKRGYCFLRCSILMLLAISGLWLGSGPASRLWAIPKRNGQAAGQPAAQAKTGEQESGAKLQLGEPTRPRDREVTISLYFTPRRGEPSGSLRAEVTLPPGPWRFQRAEAPPRSAWKVSARQIRQPARGPGKTNEETVIEVSVSAGRREIPEGLIAYLRFRLDASGSPLPTGLVVASFESAPPDSETASPSADFPPLPTDPPLTPSIGCFFFTH